MMRADIVKIAVYGAGKNFHYLFDRTLKTSCYIEIVGVFDQDTKKRGRREIIHINNMRKAVHIDSLDNLQKYEYDYILITPERKKEIIRELTAEHCGVNRRSVLFSNTWIDYASRQEVIELSAKYSDDEMSYLLHRDLSWPEKSVLRLLTKGETILKKYHEGVFRGRCNCGEGVIVSSGAEAICVFPGSIDIGQNTVIKGQLNTWKSGKIKIGRNCYLGDNSFIWAAKGVFVGDRVLIGHNCNIFDNNTHPKDSSMRAKQYLEIITVGQPDVDLAEAEIRIDDDVWIAEGCMIMKGVHIERGSIIAAKTVVNKNVPPNSMAWGNPMQIKSLSIIQEH